MAFDIPFNLLALFVGMVLTMGLLGIILGLKKIQGAPFITVFAGIMLFAIFVMTNNVSIGHTEAIQYTLNYPMNVTTGSTGLNFGTTNFIIAEKPANTNSVLYNKKFSCISFDLRRTANPTGDVRLGVYDTDGKLIKAIGNITASTISTVQKSYVKCLPNHDYYTISLYDRIGAEHRTSDGTNFVTGFVTAGNDFDGLNSIRSTYITSAWTDVTATDIRMILIDDSANIIDNPVNYKFGLTSSPAPELTAFFIIFSVLFVFLGMMIQIQKWS